MNSQASHPPTHRKIAVIGTAGRDKTQPMEQKLWLAMTTDLRGRVQQGDVLISGGAAWADHLAVYAFLQGWCSGLELYLPAPLTEKGFAGPHSSSASAANYYHQRFKAATGVDGIAQLRLAISQGAVASEEPVAPGYGAMFARNQKVAMGSTSLIAYTFGDGDQPADGGTLDTWKKASSRERIHVALLKLLREYKNSEVATPHPTAPSDAPSS